MSTHQSQLLPEENKFHRGNGEDGKHYWITPPELYAELNAQYSFDFDPCPYPKPEGFDGLTCDWGQSNYVNPPFGSIMHQGRKKGPTAWARKAIAEHAKGKTVVLVYPIDKWVLMLLAAGAEVRNLGDVRWQAIEDGSAGKGTGRHIAAFVLKGAERTDREPQGMTKVRNGVYTSKSKPNRVDSERIREIMRHSATPTSQPAEGEYTVGSTRNGLEEPPAAPADLPAIESALNFIEENLTPRRCDSDGVASCVRCTALFLTRKMRKLIGASPADRETK